MRMRWDCRYSSCEMMYLVLEDQEVRMYLDHSPDKADRYTLEQVAAGVLDPEVRALYGAQALSELHAAVADRIAHGEPPVETPEQARPRRRREG